MKNRADPSGVEIMQHVQNGGVWVGGFLTILHFKCGNTGYCINFRVNMETSSNLATKVEDSKDGLSLTDEEDDDYEHEHHLPETARNFVKMDQLHSWLARQVYLLERWYTELLQIRK